MRTVATALLLATIVFAGCTTPAAIDPSRAPDSPSSTGGRDEPSTTLAAWPAAESAAIRPGVQVVSETGQCTSNFLFASADNASLYLGLAAHCVEGLELGAPLDIADGAATGTLAYSSWRTMDEIDETDATTLDANDFALILLPPEARGLAHPGMMHFGGPTALAASAGVATGDKVLTYGNSGLRGGVDTLSWHEGYAVEASEWTTTIYTATPGVPGDSGSGVLTGDGRALGILVTLQIAPLAGSNGVTHLDRALDYAREHAGIDVTLATWALENGGVLPGA